MELLRFPSRGGFSVRSILAFVLTVVITALLWTTLVGSPTSAQNANWNGASIEYNDKRYVYAGESTSSDGTGFSANSPYYVHLEQPSTASPSNATQKAYVIYFAPGASPPQESSANYVEMTYDSNKKTYSNPTNQASIALDASTASSSGSSCAIEGIGWLACPAMTWLAKGMDSVFDIIAGFMEVQPLQTGDTNGALYKTWNTMRSIGNIAFIIAFLIIIYSQLTNVQVNNYGIKKLLPRLIIAAVAVNVSYFIAAAAVDISNILGYSIQNMFMGLQQSVATTGNPDPAATAELNSLSSWAGFTAFAMSGGTAAVVGVASTIAATGGTATAAVYILLPVLVGLLLTLIVVFLILAARQALIVILVIIAPLALVAYLLPNTEKWFDKWRSLLMTMLVFFPAFAVVFGGAQLAGSIIIQNANSITMQLLGMVVHVAPLVITPLLLKLSGGVLGNIARIVNNPNKGVVDRTRNWSKDRAEWHRRRGVGGLDRKGNPMDLKKRNFMRNSARYLDQRKRRLGDRTTNAETATQTAYEGSKLYAKEGKYNMAEQKAYYEHKKNDMHSTHEDHVNKARRTEGSLVFQAGVDDRASKKRAEASQNYTEAFYTNAERNQKLAGGALHASGYKLELSKSKLETSSNQTKAYFDTQRATRGSDLYAAAKPLETSKLVAEAAQTNYAAVVADMKANGSLRTTFVEAERSKQAQQVFEAQATKVSDNFRSGKIDPTTLSVRERGIMAQMRQDSITLSAEKQAASSAQYEIQKNIADIMNGSGPEAEYFLDIAQGVGGPAGRVRARAQAVQASRSLENDALKVNVELLKNDAQRARTTINDYSAKLLQAKLSGLATYDDKLLSDERIRAALQAQAEEKNIPLFEQVKGSRHFDQAMVAEIVALNNTNFKVAGGFGLQADPSLNIENFNTEEEYWHALRAQRMSNLSSTNATGLSSLKFGWVINSLAGEGELQRNIKAALQEAERGNKPDATDKDREAARRAKANLEGAYKTVRDALLNDDIRATMNDREKQVREIEAELARIHGQAPVPSEPLDIVVDASSYAPGATDQPPTPPGPTDPPTPPAGS